MSDTRRALQMDTRPVSDRGFEPRDVAVFLLGDGAIVGFSFLIWLLFFSSVLWSGASLARGEMYCKFNVLPRLETYRIQHGRYPEDIAEIGLQTEELPVSLQKTKSLYGHPWYTKTDHGYFILLCKEGGGLLDTPESVYSSSERVWRQIWF